MAKLRRSYMCKIRNLPGFLCKLIQGVVVILAVSSFTNAAAQQGAPADMVLRNGAVYTVDRAQPWATALAIRDGVIAWIGGEDEIELHIGANTAIVDLDGRFVMPGIHDVHTHPLEAFNDAYDVCILEQDRSVEALVDEIARCAERNRDDEWLIGWGFLVDDLIEGQAVTGKTPAQLLDEVVPDRPVVIMEFTSHISWANTKAMELAGFAAETPDPPGGIIVRDRASGEPTGLLIDSAGDVVRELPYKPTGERLEAAYEGLLEALEELARNGITSIADARVFWSRGHHEVWARAEREDELTARTVLGLWAYPQFDDDQFETLKELYSNDPDRLLRFSQIKLYADGIIGVATAAMHRPYRPAYDFVAGNRGLNYFDEARMTKIITELEPAGFDFHIHAIGDRGINEALNAIEAAGRANGPGIERRHRLTHVEIVDPDDIPRFAELGVIADFQVAGDWSDPQQVLRHTRWLIGRRGANAAPLRSFHNAGATITLSSDYDVSTMNPFVGMANALNRSRQALPDMASVIEAYTINGAYTLRQEDRVGSLEVGKEADLVVLDRNLLEIDPDDIADTRVLWTLLAGEEVWRDPAFQP